MIRPLTLLSVLMFVASGAYLFAVKQHAQTLDDQIAETAQETRLDQQRIRVLQAQWALEVDPSRLAKLAAQFTPLQPMRPTQLVTLAALEAVLPPPDSAAPRSNPEGGVAPVPAAAAPSAALVAEAGTALPLPPPAQAPVATRRPAGPTAASSHHAAPEMELASVERVLHRLPAHEVAHAAAHRDAHAAMPRPRAMPRAIAVADRSVLHADPLPPPVRRDVPMGARVLSVRAVAQGAAPPVPPMPSGGSMLGMAQNMGASGSGG